MYINIDAHAQDILWSYTKLFPGKYFDSITLYTFHNLTLHSRNNPWSHIFKSLFCGCVWMGLENGGAYFWREICVSNSNARLTNAPCKN